MEKESYIRTEIYEMLWVDPDTPHYTAWTLLKINQFL